jgi:hypothetical protein
MLLFTSFHCDYFEPLKGVFHVFILFDRQPAIPKPHETTTFQAEVEFPARVQILHEILKA